MGRGSAGAGINAWPVLTLAVLTSLILMPIGRRALAQNQEAQQISLTTQDYRPGTAQQAQNNAVNVHVVVRDSKGEPVGGLQKSDFALYDDGKLQEISNISVQQAGAQGNASGSAATTAPATSLALFFDDRDLEGKSIEAARATAEFFIKQAIASGDRVGVFTASGTVHQDFTNDTNAFASPLNQIKYRPVAPEDRMACPAIDVYQAFLIARMNDDQALSLASARGASCGAVTNDMIKQQSERVLGIAEQNSQSVYSGLDAALRSLSQVPGRRILVMMSTGFWTGTLQQQQDAIVNEALSANVIINSLDAKALFTQTPGTGIDEQRTDGTQVLYTSPNLSRAADQYSNSQDLQYTDVLDGLAGSTGGEYFRNTKDVGNGIERIVAVPDVSYTLSFLPTKLNNQQHKLAVKLAQKQPYTVESRQAYFAAAPKANKGGDLLEKLNQEALSNGKLDGLSVDVKTQTGKLDTGATGARVMVHIDVTDIPFKKEHGRRVDDVLWATVLLNDKGEVVDGRLSTINMALKDDMFSTLSQKGINAHMDLNVPPGTYHLREIVAETGKGKIFASSENVSVQ